MEKTTGMEGFCKGCLVKYEDLSQLLQYTEKNRRLFVYSTGLQVKQNDQIPFQLCQSCFLKMKLACQFKKQCRTSDKRFNHFLSIKEAGEDTNFSTYLQNNDGSLLFKFPLNGHSTPSFQKRKDDDNVSTNTSIRNFMTDFLREDAVPDTEANIIREMIEQEADVLDESLDSQWLEDDISIASDFRFSPYSTPLWKNNYQPPFNYSPVKEEKQEEEQIKSRKNLIAAKKLLLSPLSCSTTQTEHSTEKEENQLREDQNTSKKNLLAAKKLLLSPVSCSTSQSESTKSKQSEKRHSGFIAAKKILLNPKLSSKESQDESSTKSEENVDQNSYIAKKRILLKAKTTKENNSRKDIFTYTHISKPYSNEDEGQNTATTPKNIADKVMHESLDENNLNQGVEIARKGFYVETVETNDNTIQIADIAGADGKSDIIDKNIKKLLNDTNDEVISLSALFASPSRETVPQGIISTPSVHRGLSGANTPSIENILFGDKLDGQSINKAYELDQPRETTVPATVNKMDILEDFFDKETGKYVGENEQNQKEIFEDYKNPNVNPLLPGKCQYDLTDFSCKNCKLQYKTEKGLKIHLAKTHGIKLQRIRTKESRAEMPCDFCGKIFSLKTNLTKHIKAIHVNPKTPQVCKVCSLEFTSQARLNIHMGIHDGVKRKPQKESKKSKLMCNICGHVSSHPGNLRTHIARHSKSYTCFCDHCGAGYYRKSDLRIHMRIHLNELPFKCRQCAVRFRRKDQLQIHLKRHAGECPYICQICDKRFATSARLKAHKDTSNTCQNKQREALRKENKAIEESLEQLYVAETQGEHGNEKIKEHNDVIPVDNEKETGKVIPLDNEKTANAAVDELQDITMEDLLETKKKSIVQDDDKISLSDMFTIPIIMKD